MLKGKFVIIYLHSTWQQHFLILRHNLIFVLCGEETFYINNNQEFNQSREVLRKAILNGPFNNNNKKNENQRASGSNLTGLLLQCLFNKC